MTELFDSEFLARLEYLALVSKRIVRGELRADRVTQVRGSGVQFADYRAYRPGDDFRYVDWNAYARLGSLLLKLFDEEQDLHVYLLLDQSRSMRSGDPDKLDYAKRLVGALAYITLSNLDRAGVSLFVEGVNREAPPIRGKGRILSLLRLLEKEDAMPGRTDLSRSVEQFLHRTRRRGIVVLVSDLLDRHGYQAALDRVRFSRHQLYVVQVTSPEDRNPDISGDVELVDVESGAGLPVTVTEHLLGKYQDRFDAFLGEINAYARRHEVPLIQVSTDLDLEEVILNLFRRGGLVQ